MEVAVADQRNDKKESARILMYNRKTHFPHILAFGWGTGAGRILSNQVT